jgi:hypothetical protein
LGWKRSSVIAVVCLTMVAAGCGIVTGRRSFSTNSTNGPAETSSAATEIGASSGQIASDTVDPCTLSINNTLWRDHGGVGAYEKRCGHPPPRQ